MSMEDGDGLQPLVFERSALAAAWGGGMRPIPSAHHRSSGTAADERTVAMTVLGVGHLAFSARQLTTIIWPELAGSGRSASEQVIWVCGHRRAALAPPLSTQSANPKRIAGGLLLAGGCIGSVFV